MLVAMLRCSEEIQKYTDIVVEQITHSEPRHIHLSQLEHLHGIRGVGDEVDDSLEDWLRVGSLDERRMRRYLATRVRSSTITMSR